MTELEKISEEVGLCHKCPLHKTRIRTVPGEGNPRAEILFIGEGPGKNEDEQGRPFVGVAGRILDAMLETIGLRREDVFIANVVKCRPPMNRDPLPEEVGACADYLTRQVAAIQPHLIVLLGRHAMERFLPGLKISTAHGKPKRRDGQVYYPVYHPAATIYNQALKADLEGDFRRIPKVIEIIKGEGAKQPELFKEK